MEPSMEKKLMDILNSYLEDCQAATGQKPDVRTASAFALMYGRLIGLLDDEARKR